MRLPFFSTSCKLFGVLKLFSLLLALPPIFKTIRLSSFIRYQNVTIAISRFHVCVREWKKMVVFTTYCCGILAIYTAKRLMTFPKRPFFFQYIQFLGMDPCIELDPTRNRSCRPCQCPQTGDPQLFSNNLVFLEVDLPQVKSYFRQTKTVGIFIS